MMKPTRFLFGALGAFGAFGALPALLLGATVAVSFAPSEAHAERFIHVLSGKCIHPRGRSIEVSTRLVVHSNSCYDRVARELSFRYDAERKRLVHSASDLCVQPEEAYDGGFANNPVDNTPVILGDCSNYTAEFDFVRNRYLRHMSGKCIQVRAGFGQTEVNAHDDAGLVVRSGCLGDRPAFRAVDPRYSALPAAPPTQDWTILRHIPSGLCAEPEGGRNRNNTTVVLYSNCSKRTDLNTFVMLPNGAIYHPKTGKCVHPHGGRVDPHNNTRLVLHSGCQKSGIKFQIGKKNTVMHTNSGKCIHPGGGAHIPKAGTGLVVHDGCDEGQRIEFRFMTEHEIKTGG